MNFVVRGFGKGSDRSALKGGDLYVARGPKNALLVLAGPTSNDTLDLVLAIEGEYFDDTPPPYRVYRSGFSAVPALVEGSIEIRPLEGSRAFLIADESMAGTLAIAPDGTSYVRCKSREWINIESGEQADKPNGCASYSQWRIVWRDGDRLETLAVFGVPSVDAVSKAGT
nr:hypothetical protein [uncultured Brevundimonas sp.]